VRFSERFAVNFVNTSGKKYGDRLDKIYLQIPSLNEGPLVYICYNINMHVSLDI
jgi:hypothetical protein